MAKLTLIFLVLFSGYGEECESCQESGQDTELEEKSPSEEFFEILEKNVWEFVDVFMVNECKEACESLGYGAGAKFNAECEKECKDFRSQPYFTMEDRPPLRDLRLVVAENESQNDFPQDENIEVENPQEGGCGCSGGGENEYKHPEEAESSQGILHGQELSEDQIKKLNLDL